MAQPFDAERAAFVGDAVPVAEDALYIAGARYGAFSVSQTGILVYNMGLVDMQSEIVWLDRTGEEIQKVSTGDLLFDVMISPDGRSAAVAQLEVSVGSPDIWIYDLERGLSTRFTFDPTNDWYPAWSPDGSRVAFASSRSGNEDIWVKEVGGSGRAELLQEGGENQVFPRGWSPDGEWLIYEQVDPANNTDLYAVRADGSETVALVASSFTETFASISPDGRWLAFVSNESGANEVYVTTFPRPARRWQISTDGGSFPRWRGDSEELFFARANGELFGVEVDVSGEALVVGRVDRLFNWSIAPGFRWPYDVSADGQRFLVIRGMAAAQTDPMAVVLNWDVELETERR
jgi:Tol biopolymer transport system component